MTPRTLQPSRARGHLTQLRAIPAATEFALIACLFTLYKAGRSAAKHHASAAWANARWAHRVDEVLSHPSTPWIQHHLDPSVLHAANVYYTTVHFPLAAVFLVGCYITLDRSNYRWVRNTLVATTLAALVVEVLVPLAPPRMFTNWGYVDTMATLGPSAYSGKAGQVANQLAAMPSLHVGWAVLLAMTLWKFAPRGLAALGTLHALTTIVVVTITANHWRIDGIAAIALVLACARLASPARQRRRGRDARHHRAAHDRSGTDTEEVTA